MSLKEISGIPVVSVVLSCQRNWKVSPFVPGRGHALMRPSRKRSSKGVRAYLRCNSRPSLQTRLTTSMPILTHSSNRARISGRFISKVGDDRSIKLFCSEPILRYVTYAAPHIYVVILTLTKYNFRRAEYISTVPLKA
jgi:hypothetical protein